MHEMFVCILNMQVSCSSDQRSNHLLLQISFRSSQKPKLQYHQHTRLDNGTNLRNHLSGFQQQLEMRHPLYMRVCDMWMYVCMRVQVCASGLLAPKQVRSVMVPLDAEIYQALLQVLTAGGLG